LYIVILFWTVVFLTFLFVKRVNSNGYLQLSESWFGKIKDSKKLNDSLISDKRGYVALMYSGTARSFSANFQSHIFNLMAGCPYTVHLFFHTYIHDSRFPDEFVPLEYRNYRSINATLEYLEGYTNIDGQQVFFTSIAYQPLQNLEGESVDIKITEDTTLFLLTGIANANPLVQHLQKSTSYIIHHNYADHHRFSLKNISKLAGEFSACPSKNKLIITTEKDAQRLVEHELLPLVKQLPVLVMPIGVNFLNGTQQQFNQLVINYVR